MKSAQGRRPLAGSPFAPPVVKPVETFCVDDRVTHDQYGLGKVKAVDAGAGVLVDFGTRSGWITAPFNKLSKL